MSPFIAMEAVAEDVAVFCEAIAKAASSADRVIVNIHWGLPLGWVAAPL